MPLSEHEQRMLEQIENALYEEDPQFASHVRGAKKLGTSSRKGWQAGVIFAAGLLLLVGGVVFNLAPGGFPVVSLLGFLVMFGAGLFFMWGGSGAGKAKGAPSATGQAPAKGSRPSFSNRMEERFRKRFDS